MLALELLIVLGAIFIGARLGSIGIGLAGGIGVLLLGLIGVPVDQAAIPFDVIFIIMAVIAAISAMQVAGGMDYLVGVADRFLRKHPKQITLWAPIVTYFMTLFAGTGHTAFSTLPVIVEVAKENDIRPSKPLSIAVVASQMAITASPISAAVVFFASILEPQGVDYVQLLAIAVPSTLLAVVLTSFLANMLGKPLAKDPVYQERLAKGLVKATTSQQTAAGSRSLVGAGVGTGGVAGGDAGLGDDLPAVPDSPAALDRLPGANVGRTSVLLFLAGIVAVVAYATSISETVGLITEPTLPRNEAIITIMLTVGAVIAFLAKFDPAKILKSQVFQSGMSATVCILGVAWLGTTFVNARMDQIQALAGDVLSTRPWTLAVVLLFASALLYSQAATTKALMPAALALGVGPLGAIAAFPAVSALFILPTYPTLLAAVEMDDTGSTRIGKFVFNHPFLLPGLVNIALAVTFGFLIGSVVL
ncbi:anaerobic C4-dicarboxylate transporter [Egicoccus halophilus]|uniref:C4-dicarboxylate transporter DcuA n=1 Tax=Egicoccus halophilus TaxID=1670830 RepID=A0A8J3A909_9ACTN|nr:anaerobic C4-dicarboxylate transporter [Egicoccus halophilus]GGI07133.1 anaerobic C4-dicarboxylate transporter [Egicoccus halophilus]